jgi:hypothetical protein
VRVTLIIARTALAGVAVLAGVPCAAKAQAVNPSAHAGGQAPAPEPKGRRAGEAADRTADGAARAAESLRVRNVLAAVAEDAKGWADAATAAGVLADVADLSWEAAPESAAVYLEHAWAAAGRVEGGEKGDSAFRNVSPRLKARQRVLLVARVRAPEKAQKWMEELERESAVGQEGRPRGAFDDRTQRSTVLLRLAMSAALSGDLQAASQLAVQSLQDGISFGLQEVLVKIQGKDFEVAKGVFYAALSRLKARGFTDPNELLTLHAYLYTPGRVFGAGASDERDTVLMSMSPDDIALSPAAKLDPQMASTFLGVAAELLLGAPLPLATADPQSTARRQIGVINMLRWDIEKQFPELGAALRQRAQQIERDAGFSPARKALPADFVSPLDGEGQKEYSQRKADRLEELAGKTTDPLARDIAYANAALACGVEQYERSLGLAGRVRDDALRVNVNNWLNSRATLEFIRAEAFDKASELIRKNEDPLHQASCLVVGAQGLVKAKQASRAAEWLQGARALLKKISPEESATRVALGIASTHARFNHAGALDDLAEAVKLINRAAPPSTAGEGAPLVARFSGLTADGLSHGTGGFGLQSAINGFTATEFEYLLGILDGISNAEVRGLAKVSLCRKNLQSPERSNRSGSFEPQQ